MCRRLTFLNVNLVPVGPTVRNYRTVGLYAWVMTPDPISERELAVMNTPELDAALRRGLAQAAEGRTVKVTFADPMTGKLSTYKVDDLRFSTDL